MAIRHKLGAVTASIAAAALVATGMATAASADEGPVEAGVTVKKVESLPADFINGVDVSSVLSLEESGVVFRDESGEPADLFEVLADHGINSVRLRVWNDPFNSITGAGYGGGNVDAERAGIMAKRATDAGLGVLVDFHYADFWAHPGQQPSPKAWEGLDVAERADALSAYTTDALQTILDAGGDIDMVQVGNETNDGQIAGESGWANTGPLFAAGAAAVKDLIPDALVAVHWANPNSQDFVGAAQQLEDAGVDYDVFASSYYPFWHGSLANLTAKLTAVADGFDKDVMVAETSWAYTLEDGDGHENTVRVGSNDTGAAYPFSVQGQATQLRDVIQAVADVGDAGIGVYYWEPAWIPVGAPGDADNAQKWEDFGSGWAASHAAEYSADAGEYYGGSAVDNQALFDFDGNPLESLRGFEYARTGAIAPRAVSQVEHPSVTFRDGEAIELPATVRVDYNDFTSDDETVTWSAGAQYIDGVGTYEIEGETASGHPTTVTVTVAPATLLTNGDFEAGDDTGWAISADPWPTAWWVRSSASDVRGEWALGVWQDNAADAELSAEQTVTGLEPGEYSLWASAHGNADDSNALSAELYAGSGGAERTQSVKFAGWDNWRTPTIENIEVGEDGTLTLGIRGVAGAGSWAWFDDFVLTPQLTATDTSALEELVDRAESLTRDVYSDASLVAVDAALERAQVVLSATNPTASALGGAEVALEDALAALEVQGDVPAPTVVPVNVTFEEGEDVVLPDMVTLRAFDGSTSTEPVTWSGAQDAIRTAGTFTVSGVSASGYAAVATVEVTARNWLVNGSFEDAAPAPWNLTTSGSSDGTYIGASGDASDGSRALVWYDAADFTVGLEQAVHGLPAGMYAVTATGQGRDTSGVIPAPADVIRITAHSGSSDVAARMTLDGWHGDAGFVTTTTEPITVATGDAVTVGATLTLEAEAWGTLDDFRLVRVADASVDASGLDDAITAGQGVERDLYTPGSLAALDLALERGEIVRGSIATQDELDTAAAAITLAIADLIDKDGTETPDPTPDPTPTPTPTGPGEPGNPTDPTDPENEGDGSGTGQMQASDTTFAAGDEITITVTGATGSTVEFGIQSEYRHLATVPVINGTATATVTIPADLAPGVHHLVAFNEDGTLLAQFEVTVLPAATDGDGELSSTGVDSQVYGMLAVATALLVAGLVITVRSRRQQV